MISTHPQFQILDQKQKKRIRQALAHIQRMVVVLRLRLCTYGYCTQEFQQIIRNMIGKVFTKQLKSKDKTVPEMMKGVIEYIRRRPNKTTKLLFEFLNCLDTQISQLDSSQISNESEMKRQNSQLKVKLESRNSQYLEGSSQLEKKKLSSDSQKEDILRVGQVKYEYQSDRCEDPQSKQLNESSQRRKPKTRARKNH